MSAISDSRHSSGSLTPASSSPSPPPVSPPKKGASTAAKAASLDSGSELSELTEDEQDASRASANSDTPGDKQRVTKKRNPIVPEPMWNWAYKTPSRKATESEEPVSAVSKASTIRLETIIASTRPAVGDDAGEPDTGKLSLRQTPEDGDDGGEEPNNHNLDDDDVDSQDGAADPTAPARNGETRESSTALTEEDDGDRESGWVESGAESEDDRPPADEDDEDEDSVAATDNGEDEEDDPPAKNADTASVVPIAPAASSIMAGQQLIKTPSISPSTSPEPEDETDTKKEPAKEDGPSNTAEKVVKMEPTEPETGADHDVDVDADNDNDNDDADNIDNGDADAELDPDAEADVDTEEAEMDLQPAHRAEALDVLAGIELKFALLRERLYVEKMEELAVEEAMVLQGVHPEMTYLQAELQVRHDRRLDLAEKKRKYEDNHVTLMRKVEENAVWSWWKFERDALQTEMFAEANRKRRRLEREKHLLERVQPAFRIPPPPSGPLPPKQLSVRELVDFVSVNSGSKRESLRRKRKEPPQQTCPRPALPVLTTQEIQNDLQMLCPPRARNLHPHVSGDIEPGPGMGMAPPFDPHYIDYNAPGMNGPPPTHGPYGHALPPAPVGLHHPYAPPPSGRAYQHQQPGPPMGSIFHPAARLPGPGAPPPGGYHSGAGRGPRRTPSPPMMQPYDHGAVPPFAGTSGPGLHWTPIPPVSASSSSNGAGPSKPPTVNGSGKENRRASGGKDGYDRDPWAQRERAAMYHENGVRDSQDEQGRTHAPHGSAVQQSQYPHRHTSMHQSLQGVPHHHHVVHHRHTSHHHHPPPSRSSGSQHSVPRTHEMDRHLSAQEHDARYAPPIEQPGHSSKSGGPNPFWKQEEVDARDVRHREQGRGTLLAPALAPPGQPGPTDHQQSYMMTPSQVVQGRFTPRPGENGSSRREHWAEESPHGRGRYDTQDVHYGPGSLPPLDGPARHGGHMHSRQASNGIVSPHPRNGIPLSPPLPPSGPGVAPPPGPTYATHLQSPTRLSLGGSTHASPRARASTPKGPGRPISPLPVKHLPPASAGFMGPGTPGTNGGGGVARLGTPGLAGPGTRPDGPPNGHVVGITHGPGLYPTGSGLSGPAQPLLPPDSAHMAPPKMTAVQLGNSA